MTPVIRIDDQVMDELKKGAMDFGLVFDPPNTTLRRVLDLDAPLMDVKEMKAKANRIILDTLDKYSKNKNVIEIKLNATSRKYVYIPLPKDKRDFFPDYKVSFELITDIGVSTAHVPYPQNAGGHIRGRFGPWFAKHPELKDGTKLRIEALEPGKHYKLSIVSEGV